jgi:hypothetical protein
MKIEIESVERPSTEAGLSFCGWKVSQGDKCANNLSFDEMLGLVAALTMPEIKPQINWLRTEKQHRSDEFTFEF